MCDAVTDPNSLPKGPRLEVFGRMIRQPLELITENELAAALDVKVNTLQVWRSNGEGPSYVKLGKSVFYRPADIRSWATLNTHKPQPKA